MTRPDFEFTVPVIVVGGGACGATAALAARDAGAAVLLLERDAVPLGTTGMSQGLVCAAGTAAQRAHGIDDDADTLYADIMAKTRGRTDAALARAIAEQSGPCLDWLVQAHDLPWDLDLRFKPSYGHSRARVHGWPGHTGIDMVQLLHARLASAQVDVLTEARLAEVISDGQGRAQGVAIERPDGSRELIGCGALVLAAGGFAANAHMVARHMPEVAAARCNGHEGNRGDAITAGAALGAALADMGAYQGYGMLADPQAIPVPPGFMVEGGLLVNAQGQRFVHETEDISGMVHAVLAQPGGQAWVIIDAAIEARCDYVLETRQLRALGAMRDSPTRAGLAAAIGADAAVLAAVLDDVHQAQRAGRADALGRPWPDSPPPAGPYRALKVCGAIFHTQGGLQIDASARVLRGDGSALPNVFAGGGSARSVSGPSCWGYLPAMGLSTAVTFGALAGRAAARQVA
ncbi:FAD-dependent oxidoreductase [Aquabacterium sp. OR-4]|uniref:FAD-dependent oxidoreductase n=1 Tax=Aquabacterium sp. OR-4 TaxID=2978127 RepID=UPI0021B18B77|nr:FAD-dependent oxidoreductase [Aquabacterium sp. OR-4]MDT7836949.1 FAD-dependent oxidoreductase [Aquabacterium sp. OR-4]